MADSDRLNLAEYFLDHNVPSRAGKVAVHYGDAAITYGEIHAGANRVAHALRRLGIRMEDRVLLVLPDRPEFVTSLFGILKAGGVLAMANPLVTTEDVLYYLNYTRAPVAVLAEPVARAVAERRRELPHLREALVVGGGAEAGPFLPFEKTIAAEKADFPNAPTHRDDPAVWLFTSGTSGKPKAAMHLQRDFVFNTENYAKKVLRIAESDRTLSVPKLFFGYATGTNLWFPFAVGASTVLFEEHPTPAILFALARRHSPTVLTAVPTMIAKMVQDEGARKEDLASLRVCLSAGEALPPELYRRFTERFGVEILDGIGSAEMFHIYISNRIGEVRPGTLGTLVPGYEARIVGADGGDAKDGDVGTLWIGGESRMVGYFQDKEKSTRTLRGRWVVTGDLFRRDADGVFHYEGRADDMLKVGGIFVAPGEIENCLLEHDAVRECAVVGFRDEAGLVKPRAYVALKPDRAPSKETESALVEHARKKLAHFKVPREVRFLEALPRNDRGKIERRKLDT